MLDAASHSLPHRGVLAGLGGRIVRNVPFLTKYRDLAGCGLDSEDRVRLSARVDKALLDRSASLVGAPRGNRLQGADANGHV